MKYELLHERINFPDQWLYNDKLDRKSKKTTLFHSPDLLSIAII